MLTKNVFPTLVWGEWNVKFVVPISAGFGVSAVHEEGVHEPGPGLIAENVVFGAA
jgi:hypothetical protein